MSDDVPTIAFWKGRPIDELSRDELLVVVRHLGNRVQELEALPVDWRKHARMRLGLPT